RSCLSQVRIAGRLSLNSLPLRLQKVFLLLHLTDQLLDFCDRAAPIVSIGGATAAPFSIELFEGASVRMSSRLSLSMAARVCRAIITGFMPSITFPSEVPFFSR